MCAVRAQGGVVGGQNTCTTNNTLIPLDVFVMSRHSLSFEFIWSAGLLVCLWTRKHGKSRISTVNRMWMESFVHRHLSNTDNCMWATPAGAERVPVGM